MSSTTNSNNKLSIKKKKDWKLKSSFSFSFFEEAEGSDFFFLRDSRLAYIISTTFLLLTPHL